MKFLTLWASTDATSNFQLSSFFKITSLNLHHLKLSLDYQSHSITLVHPETIIQSQEKFCYNTLTQPDGLKLSEEHNPTTSNVKLMITYWSQCITPTQPETLKQ